MKLFVGHFSNLKLPPAICNKTLFVVILLTFRYLKTPIADSTLVIVGRNLDNPAPDKCHNLLHSLTLLAGLLLPSALAANRITAF